MRVRYEEKSGKKNYSHKVHQKKKMEGGVLFNIPGWERIRGNKKVKRRGIRGKGRFSTFKDKEKKRRPTREGISAQRGKKEGGDFVRAKEGPELLRRKRCARFVEKGKGKEGPTSLMFKGGEIKGKKKLSVLV